VSQTSRSARDRLVIFIQRFGVMVSGSIALLMSCALRVLGVRPSAGHTARMSHQTFVCTHRVTYAECTMGNHVYYARYLDFLEAARGEFFRTLGKAFQQFQSEDTVFPVIEARLRYKGAARYDDVLKIEIWMTEVERVRLNFAHRILNESGKLLVEANTLHACTSIDDKLKRLPEDLVAKLQPYLLASSAA
jgi:acyl-CoA thioester hydrolase